MPLTRRAFLERVLKLAPAAALVAAAPTLLVPEAKKLYRGYSPEELWTPPPPTLLPEPDAQSVDTLYRTGVIGLDEARAVEGLSTEPFGTLLRSQPAMAYGTVTLRGRFTHLEDESVLNVLPYSLGRQIEVECEIGGRRTTTRGVLARCDRELTRDGELRYRFELLVGDTQASLPSFVLPPKGLQQVDYEAAPPPRFRSWNDPLGF